MRSTQKVPAMSVWNATSHAHVDAHETADTCDYNLHIVTNFKQLRRNFVVLYPFM